MKPKDAVDVPGSGWRQLRDAGEWDLIDALRGGTRAMRDGGTEYLPREARETSARYKARLSRAFLFEAYSDAVENCVSRPFSRPVQLVGEGVPDWALEFANSVDLAGTDLTEFSKSWMRSAVDRGLCHVFVDFGSSDARTIGEQRSSRQRPRAIQIAAEDLIGWRFAVDDAGGQILDRIRFRERAVVQVGEFLEAEVERIRVVSRDSWELWEKGEDGEYFKVEEGPMTLGEIPLVTLYTNFRGAMLASPPLLALAWKNLEHYQRSSDHASFIRFANTRIFYALGLSEDEVAGLEVGSGALWYSSMKPGEASFGVVGGASGEKDHGAEDLAQIERQMEALGMRPILERTGAVTATDATIHESHASCDVISWCEGLQAAMERVFVLAGRWVGGAEWPDDAAIQVHTDFAAGAFVAQTAAALIELWKNKGLPTETLLEELQRRGAIATNTDIERVLEMLEEERDDEADRAFRLASAISPRDEEEEDEEDGGA